MTTSPQGLLEQFLIDHPAVPGAMLHIETAAGRIWSAAAGRLDVETQQPIRADSTFRIASVTKPFVAAAILRLAEQGAIDLDNPIEVHLEDPELRAVLGSERCTSIRVHHLLTHTSGLADFVEDTDYVDQFRRDMRQEWSRLDQVRLGLSVPDAGRPGERFHYSDTGYVILGQVLEEVTGTDLGTALRALVGFEKLGLESTYVELLETAPAGAAPRVHQYLDGLDTFDANPSFDLWGGGGIVSTTRDVAAFFRALFEGDVFEREDTLDKMTAVAARADDARIGMGLGGRWVGGATLWGHGGFWGTYAGYIPEAHVGFSVVVTEQSALPALATTLLPSVVDIALTRSGTANPNA